MSELVPCSISSAAEPLAGTAPFALGWLIVEHPFSWGRDALTDSGLPSNVVAHVRRVQADGPLGFLAARRSGGDGRRRADAGPRTVWLAHCAPEGAAARVGTVGTLEEIVELDLLRLTEGHIPDFGESVAAPIEFVCTHSTRDACCAVHGRRRIATAPSDVWECSHLGGHRFAATSLFLPSGRLYGRLGPWHSPGEPDPRYLRGPCYLPPAAQAAECAVRVHADLDPEQHLRVVEVDSGDDTSTVRVRDATGRAWTVDCRWEIMDSPAACGGDRKSRRTWHTSIREEGT